MMKMTCVDSMADSYDDGDHYMEHKKNEHSRNPNKVMVSKDDVCYFLYQLQYNVVFDMVFKIKIGADNGNKRCYCPCGNTMKPWREQFFLNSIAGKGFKTYCATSKGKKKIFPSDLLGHCKDVHNGWCPIHYGIHSYVSTLHALFISSKGEKTNYEVKVKTNLHPNTEQQSVVECTPKKK